MFTYKPSIYLAAERLEAEMSAHRRAVKRLHDELNRPYVVMREFASNQQRYIDSIRTISNLQLIAQRFHAEERKRLSALKCLRKELTRPYAAARAYMHEYERAVNALRKLCI